MAIAIELDEETRQKVERLASRRQEGIDALLREAVCQFLEREEAQAGFQASALEAWANYQATGLHATFSEVDDWLRRLEAGEDVAPPKCHG